MSKEKRGIGTSLVAGIGVTGAVFAFLIKTYFDWRTCYFIGGALGFVLLFLRVGVLESGMFKTVKESNVAKGDFFMLFTSGRRLKKYLSAIFVGLPTWYIIGILITFSKEFGLKMNISGVDPGKAVMVSYASLSVGGVIIGFISQWLRSRKKAVALFYGIAVIAIFLFFRLQDQSISSLYVVCALLGFSTGLWAMFVTMAAEQFGTNIRATVATTAPNMVRGSLVFVSWLFVGLQSSLGYLTSGWVTGIVVMVVAALALFFAEETYGKDLNYTEE